jgi:periplasmic copper chaperone A
MPYDTEDRRQLRGGEMTTGGPAAIRRWRAGWTLLGAALGFALPTLQSTAAPPAADVRVTDVRVTDVRVTDAWIRWLPAGLPGAGYMTLTNTGRAPWLLTGATSPAYARIEFHRTESAHGMSAMTPVEHVTLEPHATVVFGEGGYHLMLMQPTHPVQPGERVPVLLRFDGGRTLEVPFAVRGAAAAAQ